jgi:hypothetical protein
MVKGNDPETERYDTFRRSFVGILAYDIVLSMQRMEQDDNQANRRDFVRSSFAAIEGWLWDFRLKAQSTLGDVRNFSPAEQATLVEKSFTIGSNGKLIEQIRYYPMTTMFRFIVRLAEEEFGNVLVDFGSSDWQAFNEAIDIRNRITHPKDIDDFSISDAEIEMVWSSTVWLMATIERVLESLNIVFAAHVQTMREVLAALKVGDPKMLALYNAALETRD